MSPVVTALVVRLAAGLVVILLVYGGLRAFDPQVTRETLNIVVSAIALATLLAPTKWFRR
jgi:hypothetical protein